MTDYSDLVELIEKNPDENLFVALLIDWLIEEKGMNRSEADQAVQRVRDRAHAARDVINARVLLTPGSRSESPLRRQIRPCLGNPLVMPHAIDVVHGLVEPRLSQPEYDSVTRSYWCRVIVVGGTWIMQAWAAICAEKKSRSMRRLMGTQE